MKKALALFLTALMVLSVCVIPGIAAGPEEIVIDGLLDDSGWISSDWIHVDNETGRFQSAGFVGTNLSFDFQMRTDDTDLYVAAKLNQAPVKKIVQSNTTLRLWSFIKGATVGDVESTLYQNFIDFVFDDVNNTFNVSAKTNTSATENKGANWSVENAGQITAKSVVEDDGAVIEFSVPLALLGATAETKEIQFYITLMQDNVLKTEATDTEEAVYAYNALYYGKFSDSTTDDALANIPYKKWDETGSIKLDLAAASLIDIDGVFDELFWADSSWTNVDNESGWFQTADYAEENFNYDYQMFEYGGNLFIGVKFNQAPNFTKLEQTGATNLRLWLDTNPLVLDDAGVDARTQLMDFTYDKSEGATSIVKMTRCDGITETSDVVYAATEGDDYLYMEIMIPLASLGITTDSAMRVLFTGSQDNLLKSAAVEDDPETTDVDETAEAVYGYTALHSMDPATADIGNYHKTTTPWGKAFKVEDISYVTRLAESTGSFDRFEAVHNAALGADYVVYRTDGGNKWLVKYDEEEGKVCYFDPATGEKDAEASQGDTWQGEYTDGRLTDGMGIDAYDPTGSTSVHYYFGQSEIIVDLGEVDDDLYAFGFSISSGNWGISHPYSVEVYVSDDGESWTKAGPTQYRDSAIVTTPEELPESGDYWSGFNFNIVLPYTVSGRYVKFISNSGSHLWANEIEIYSNADPDKLYVNAIIDPDGNGMYYSPAGIHFAQTGNGVQLGGAQRIIYFAEAGEYTVPDWHSAVVFAPTEEAGVYEITDVISTYQNSGTFDVAAGGFVFTSNEGNGIEYVEEGCPSEQTAEGFLNYAAIPQLTVGQTARLYNINLELLTCARAYQAYIAFDYPDLDISNEYVAGGLEYNAIDFDAFKIGGDNLALNATYHHVCNVNDSYVDTDGKELTDGVIGTGDPSDAAWIGLSGSDNIGGNERYLSVIDLGEVKSVAKFSATYLSQGWGIGIPATVSFYGSVDGENYFYIGDVQTDTDAITKEEGFNAYELVLELDCTVDVRYITVCSLRGAADNFALSEHTGSPDGDYSFVFISEVAAYGTEAVVTDESNTSEPEVPVTGDTFVIVIVVLAMVLTGSVLLVSKKRRA